MKVSSGGMTDCSECAKVALFSVQDKYKGQ
jgi:hypothetical protein